MFQRLYFFETFAKLAGKPLRKSGIICRSEKEYLGGEKY